LKRINPVNQIPVLVDGENTIWDSRQIFNYLNHLYRFQPIDWQDENILTALQGAMDGGVSLLLMKRSGVDIEAPTLYPQRLKERIFSVLDYLEPQLKEKHFQDWNFHSISLYCFLDWGVFRGIFSLEKYPAFQAFLETHKNRPIVQSTQIPKV
jgi:glutathione S-transferase